MKQCLRITFKLSSKSMPLYVKSIKQHAHKLDIEGTAHVLDDTIKIFACGRKDYMDKFIDVVYKGTKDARPDDVEIEPFAKEKEYRGVFRVIE